MSKFFPKGISTQDTKSPAFILREAKAQWERETGKVLTLDLETRIDTPPLAVVFVRAVHCESERSALLFRVAHREGVPYPATIEREEEDLPIALRKTYYRPGISGIAAMVSAAGYGQTEGRTIKNDWVAETPSEFRELLERAFNLGYVKGAVINLIAFDESSDGDKVVSGG